MTYTATREEIISALVGPHEVDYDDGYPDHFFLARERAEYLADRIINSLPVRSEDV